MLPCSPSDSPIDEDVAITSLQTVPSFLSSYAQVSVLAELILHGLNLRGVKRLAAPIKGAVHKILWRILTRRNERRAAVDLIQQAGPVAGLVDNGFPLVVLWIAATWQYLVRNNGPVVKLQFFTIICLSRPAYNVF